MREVQAVPPAWRGADGHGGGRQRARCGCPPSASGRPRLLVRLAHHGLHHLGVAVDGQDDRSLFGPVAAVGHYGQHVTAIGQAETDGEAAVRPLEDADARQRDAYEYMDVLANQHYREYESLRRVLVHAQHGHDALAYRRFFGFKIDGALVFGMVAANESVQSMATARFYNAANARSLAVSMISDRESAPVMSDDDVVKSTDIVMLDDDEWAAFDALVTVQLSKYQISKQK